MLYHKKISVIIPCRNEEAALYSLLQKMPDYVDEIVVIDNNSSDNTYRVARANGAKVFKEKKNTDGIGYGFAHQTGLTKVTGDYIISMDGDDTYPVNSIREIVTYMEINSLDFVSCNRLPLEDNQAITTMRKIGIGILNSLIAFLYGYQFIDILTGMWVMKKSVVPHLNAFEGGWDYSPEVKLAALYNKEINFSEYHIPYKLRINGNSKLNMWKTGIGHFFFIIRRRFTKDNDLNKLHFKSYALNTARAFKALIFLLLLKIK
jgi:glycosyltransferase involved in cell wall biosynthesis